MSDRAAPEKVVRFAVDRGLLRGLSVALAAGVLLALTEAFGMTGTSLLFRLGYWLPIMLMGALWGHLCSMLVERHVDLDRRPLLGVVALTVVMSGPLVVMVWAVTGWFFDDDRSVTLARLPDFIGPVLVVTGTLSALNVFLARTPVQTHAAAEGGRPARFLDRLPFKLKGAVIRAVSSEDHYLRIHTSKGSDLAVVVLDTATKDTPATLPNAGSVAALDRKSIVTSVGYGYSGQAADGTWIYDGLRRVADSPVLDVTKTLLKFSTRNGGPCMGDSGGPHLAGDTVLSLTSAGPKDCTGRSEGYRLDTVSARAFLARFVTLR